MVFNVRNRVFGEVFVDFSNDSSSHIGMEGMPQVCKRTRRRRDNKRPHIACAHELLQGGGDVSREAMLLESCQSAFSTAPWRFVAARLNPRI
jgi:hypothetical protein